MVTMRSQCGTKPLAGTLLDTLAHPAKHKRQDPAAPIRADDGPPTEASKVTLGQVTNAPPMGLESVHQNLRSASGKTSSRSVETSED